MPYSETTVHENQSWDRTAAGPLFSEMLYSYDERASDSGHMSVTSPSTPLRENSAGQIAIQCSEGSPATGQRPKNGLCHDIREDIISSGPPVE
jgi:hypothetical protein